MHGRTEEVEGYIRRNMATGTKTTVLTGIIEAPTTRAPPLIPSLPLFILPLLLALDSSSTTLLPLHKLLRQETMGKAE